jgi:hypothetical protein
MHGLFCLRQHEVACACDYSVIASLAFRKRMRRLPAPNILQQGTQIRVTGLRVVTLVAEDVREMAS